ncbi:hypothetical protein ACFLZZ_01870 [Nanoarchaeota archaeon]
MDLLYKPIKKIKNALHKEKFSIVKSGHNQVICKYDGKRENKVRAIESLHKQFEEYHIGIKKIEKKNRFLIGPKDQLGLIVLNAYQKRCL